MLYRSQCYGEHRSLPPANRLLGDALFTYAYDANGNQTSKTNRITSAQTNSTYDSENRLVQVQMPDGRSSTHKYDPWNRRIERVISSGASETIVRYIYDEHKILALADGLNQLAALFTNGPNENEPLVLRTSSGTQHFIHADGLGNIIAHTDSLGNVVERIEYSAYGQPAFIDLRGEPTVSSYSITGSPFAYTGLEWDHESQLHNHRRRYREAQASRFTSSDPIGAEGGINLYAYVDGNPINRQDLFGTAFSLPPGLMPGIPPAAPRPDFPPTPSPNAPNERRRHQGPGEKKRNPPSPPVPVPAVCSGGGGQTCDLEEWLSRVTGECVYICWSFPWIVWRDPPVPGAIESCPPTIQQH